MARMEVVGQYMNIPFWAINVNLVLSCFMSIHPIMAMSTYKLINDINHWVCSHMKRIDSTLTFISVKNAQREKWTHANYSQSSGEITYF